MQLNREEVQLVKQKREGEAEEAVQWLKRKLAMHERFCQGANCPPKCKRSWSIRWN